MRRAVAIAVLLASAPASAQDVKASALQGHDADQPIDISAQMAEVRQLENLALFQGRVEAVQGNLRLTADALRVSYTVPPEPDQTESQPEEPDQREQDTVAGGPDAPVADDEPLRPRIERVDVLGNVRIVSPGEEAQSDWARYSVLEGTLVMGGDVIFRQGETLVRADRLSLDLTTGIWQFDSADGPGGVTGSFTIPQRK